MIVARTVAEARDALRALPHPLGLVPTMGALHDGHLGLVEAARSRCASVAASLFVNPTQFGAGEDFERYPRNEARDVELLEQAGVDVVFAPAPAEMYPLGHSTVVSVRGALTGSFEGAVREGHFDGVATVVAKLLSVAQPDVAFFGCKDAQQLAVIRRMTRDLDLPVEIVAVTTVREPDGLAMSSRNAYLTTEQRAVAPRLYMALLAGANAARRPGALAGDTVAAATAVLASQTYGPRFAVEYVAVVHAGTFEPEREIGPDSLLIAAVRLGATRLIDNIRLGGDVPSRDQTSHAG